MPSFVNKLTIDQIKQLPFDSGFPFYVLNNFEKLDDLEIYNVSLNKHGFENNLRLFYDGIRKCYARKKEYWELLFGTETKLSECATIMHSYLIDWENKKKLLVKNYDLKKS